MKKKNIFSMLLVLAMLLGMAQPALASYTAANMQLSITEGTVSVSNAAGRSLSLRDNMRLYSGYQVETAANSYAWINLDSTKLIKLDASTRVEVRESGKKLEVLLKSGSMYGDVSKPLEADETLDIRTSTTIVGIRGTKFSVAQVRAVERAAEAAVQWATRVQVYEGAVAVRAQQNVRETVVVAAGNQLTVAPGTQETEIFAESRLASEDISGYAAIELVKDPETLENLGMDISAETARELLERDQTDAEERRAEADAGKTGLETDAAPDIVWEGGSKPVPPSGGGNTSRPDPGPAPVYTVTFDPNGGAWDGDTAVKTFRTGADGLLTGSVPDPAREGFVFDGWYTGASGGTEADLSAAFTADTTLYARWTALPTYTVAFDPNGGAWDGGSAPKTFTTNTDGLLTGSVPDPAREGFVFDGWYTSVSGGTAVDLSAAFTADTTLYARWAALPTYAVTFDPNGGAWDGGTTPKTLATNTDGLLTGSIPDPAREGFVFDGWYTGVSGGTEADLSAVFTADTTLYARWTALPTYAVTFDPNGGAWDGGSAPKTLTTNTDGLLTGSVPDPSRSGFAFDGWYTSASGGTAADLSAAFTADTTLYARWKALYTVTFNPNGGAWGGDSAPRTLTTDPDGLLTGSVPAPSRSGYTFGGWYTSASGGTAVNTSGVFTSDTAVYAHWTALPVYYTVTFDPNGGAWDGDSTPKTRTTNTSGLLSGSVPDPARGGYAFDGWYTSASGGTAVNTSGVFASDTTVYAHWTALAAQYTVTFDPNGGGWDGDTASKELITETDGRLDAGSIPADPALGGSFFKGWYTSAAGGSRIDDLTACTFTADTRLYAQWQKSYTITFDPGARGMWAADDTAPRPFMTGAAGTLTQAVPDPAGRSESPGKFIGWFTEETGGIQIDPAAQVFTADTVLYARWVPYYRITFNGNGGSVDGQEAQVFLTGEDGTLTSLPSELTRADHVFAGWNTQPDGSGAAIATDGLAVYTFTANTTLYAQWVSPYVTVQVDQELSEDGSQEAAQQKIQNLLNDPLCEKVTVELTSYTSAQTGGSVSTLYIKGALTVPAGKELEIRCPFRVGSSASGSGVEEDGRAPAAGTLDIQGTMTAGTNFTNSGTITVQTGGVFRSNTYMTDAPVESLAENLDGAVIENHGSFEVLANFNFVNRGGFLNAGTLTNYYSITNEAGGTITNKGTITNDGTVTNEGTITNDGTYTGPAVTGGTITGGNASQIQNGNP